ncbi:MAG: ABC transporter ATP-binding protein [Candidatus Marinimicrobia bacterium]|nr:ABC transporter ATP-binding protein [Candidatus Neomarinimicrobiota bacterium]
MDDNHIVEIRNLVKRFPMGGDHFLALKGISLDFAVGEFTGLVGPSGSGKTTLLNIVGGLDSPSEGQVTVLGHNLAGTSHKQRAELRRLHMGFIFQTYNLLPVYTVYENVEFPLLLNGVPADERKRLVTRAIELVGLSDKMGSRPAQLSGGEGQRTAIARAIVKEPTLVLADEPTANLDAENSHHVMKILVSLNKELSTSFIFATHDDKVMAYLHRILNLVDGKIVKDELVENPELKG